MMSRSVTQNVLPAIKCRTFIDVPVERVFKTLTTAEGWDAWFTRGMKLELRPGGEIEFVWKQWGPDHVDCVDGGRIIEVVPNEKFVFTWHREIPETTVSFELSKRGDGTVVDLSDSGYAPNTIDVTGGLLDCACGWGEALALLKMYLEHGVTYGVTPK